MQTLTYYTQHERLYQARNILRTRIRQGNLFTYLDVKEEENLTVPPTNNAIESFNAKIRSMLRLHRGTSITHQILPIRLKPCAGAVICTR